MEKRKTDGEKESKKRRTEKKNSVMRTVIKIELVEECGYKNICCRKKLVVRNSR